MSYGSDLYTLINADSSLNSWCDGGIYYENLPDNFDLTKIWLAYSFNKAEQTNCLNGGSAFTTYNITIKIVSYDSDMLETISDYLVDYLNGSNQGNIMDVWFTGDNHTIDLEKGVYMNSLDFESFYV